VFSALQPQYLGQKPLKKNFKLKSISGEEVNFQKLKGNILIINFWSLSCQSCLKELPTLMKLAQRFRYRDDLKILAINVDKNFSEIKKYLKKGKYLSILLDPDQKVASLFGTYKFPETFILDREGNILARFDGERDWSSKRSVVLIKYLLSGG
jgi:thiol-disulfide isomerase/thioredoxin